MKTKPIKFLMASIGLACISFGVLLSNNNLVSVNAQEDRLKAPLMTYTNGDAATYYNGIDSSKSGNALLSDLYSLNHSKRKSAVGYKEMGTSPSGMFKYTDYDPSTVQYDTNGQPYGTKILSFYSGTSTTSWNREHVWPNSRGGGSGGNAGSDWLPDADIFMPRPTISSENSNRGNSKYVEGMKSSSDGWDPVTAFGVDGCYLNSTSVRGECARIIFYCMTVNNNLVLDDTNNGGTTGVTMGKLSDLLKWNLENPVNQREINRNEGGEYLQGNRNAFVDHPEYACKIWGNYNENTKRICGASEEAPTTITLTVDKEVVAVGDKANITVSVDKGSSQVVWDSSDKTVATVSNGVVSTIKAGVTEISARSALDPNVVGKITITVKAVKELSYTGTPTKTSYKSGEYFDSTGLTVTATFTDSSTENVTSLVTWEPSPLYQGLTEVTGKYAGKSIKVSGLTVAKADPIATKTITFRSNGSDDNNSMTDDQVKAEIIEGAEEVSSISNAVNVYKGKIGLKLGKSSATGSLEINLKNTFTDVKQIKVKAAQYGSDTSGLIINDQTIEIDSSEETEYT
ncbi:MAG: endonuclease, partial [Bacilli bacterium]|nr:endonuclease [Bacilli bacterium]